MRACLPKLFFCFTIAHIFWIIKIQTNILLMLCLFTHSPSKMIGILFLFVFVVFGSLSLFVSFFFCFFFPFFLFMFLMKNSRVMNLSFLFFFLDIIVKTWKKLNILRFRRRVWVCYFYFSLSTVSLFFFRELIGLPQKKKKDKNLFFFLGSQ